MNKNAPLEKTTITSEAPLKKIKYRRSKFKIFADWYYVFQWVLIHLIFFGWRGFAFDSVYLVLRTPKAFDFGGIWAALQNFGILFKGATLSSILMLIIFSIWYLIILAWKCKWIVIYAISVWQIICFVVFKFRIKAHEKIVDLNHIFVIKAGAPGCGKSSSGGNEAVIIARKKWQTVLQKYFIYSSKVCLWESNPQKYKRQLRDWNEVKFCYEYFTTPQEITTETGEKRWEIPFPCLLSNIPMQVDGQWTCELNIKHFTQEERAPAYCAWFVDEIGSMLDIDSVKDRASNTNINAAQRIINIAELARLVRHFYQTNIIGTEQQRSNFLKDARNVVSKNEIMLSQTWVLRPWPLIFLYTPFKWLCLKFNRPNPNGKRTFNRILAPPLEFFDRLITGIGFRKFKYKVEGGEQGNSTGSAVLQGKKTFYLNSILDFKYHDRTYCDFLLCKDDEPYPKIFTSFILKPNEYNRRKPRPPKVWQKR